MGVTECTRSSLARPPGRVQRPGEPPRRSASPDASRGRPGPAVPAHVCFGGTGLASVVMAVAGARADQGVSDRLGHGDVVAVGAVDRPAHRYAVTLGGDRPLPAELGPIRWIGAGSLAPIWRLVQRAMQGDIVEVEADD